MHKLNDRGILKEDIGDLREGDEVIVTHVHDSGLVDLARVVEDHEYRVIPEMVDWDND